LIKTFIEQVRAETIWFNDPLTDNYAGPCGGMKMSGNAREPGLEGLDSFLETSMPIGIGISHQKSRIGGIHIMMSFEAQLRIITL
jgi:hypothetical protein